MLISTYYLMSNGEKGEPYKQEGVPDVARHA